MIGVMASDRGSPFPGMDPYLDRYWLSVPPQPRDDAAWAKQLLAERGYLK